MTKTSKYQICILVYIYIPLPEKHAFSAHVQVHIHVPAHMCFVRISNAYVYIMYIPPHDHIRSAMLTHPKRYVCTHKHVIYTHHMLSCKPQVIEYFGYCPTWHVTATLRLIASPLTWAVRHPAGSYCIASLFPSLF